MRCWRAVLCSLLLATLSACGGGGGGGGVTSLSLSTSSLTFTADPSDDLQEQSVTVQYKGTGVVIGRAPGVTRASWISVSDNESTDPSPTSFRVYANPRGLAPGRYTTSLRFTTGIVPASGDLEDATHIIHRELAVTLDVVNFSLSHDRVNLSLPEGSPAVAGDALTLSADAGMQWTTRSNQPWLVPAPGSGTGPASIGYSIQPANLSRGEHTGVITVAGTNGLIEQVTVVLNIRAVQLASDTELVSFDIGANASEAARTRSFSISDDVGGQVPAKALSWTMSPVSVPWLAVSPTSGSSAPARTVTARIPAEVLATMPNGSYSTSLRFNYVSADTVSRTLEIPVRLDLDAPLVSVSVSRTGSGPATAQGTPVEFRAQGVFAHGYQADVSTLVRWTSSAPSVAAVGEMAPGAALAQPLSPGSTMIRATAPGSAVQGSLPLQVKAAIAAAYVLSIDNLDRRISQFLVAADGQLQPMAAPSLPAGEWGNSLVFAPDGKSVYVIDAGSAGLHGVYQFRVQPSGALTPMDKPRVGLGGYVAQAMAVESTGRHAYVLTGGASGDSSILRLDIAPDGSLTLDSRPPVRVGEYAVSIAASPVAPYLYSPDTRSLNVQQFMIGLDGAVAPLAGVPARVSGYPRGINVHPSGKYVYVTDYFDSDKPATVAQFLVGKDGELVPMAPASVEASSGARAQFLALSPSGKQAYLSFLGRDGSGSSGVATFAIDENGKLVPRYSYVSGYARQIAVDLTGKHLYLTTGYDRIVQFDIGDDGTLVQSYIVNSSNPMQIVIRPIPAP